MKYHYDVFVVGDYCLDLIFTGLRSKPVLGKEIISSGFGLTTGGTCNSVIALHRLGVKVGWAADFGNDEFSQIVLKKLRNEHIDEALFIHHKNKLRFITVSLSYPEDRAFIAYYDQSPQIPAALKAASKVDAALLYIPGLLHGPRFRLAKKLLPSKKMKIMMDGNYPEWLNHKDKQVRYSIENVDIFSCNSDEALRLTGEKNIEKSISQLGRMCPIVMVKAGSRGAYGIIENNLEFVPSIKVRAVDTTGAGDCFNAGFIKAWLEEKTLKQCLQYGNIVGGLSTLGRGGTEFIVNEDDIIKRLRNFKV
jgi:sugar/nucleoside kinase (ribokinase family)